MFAFDNVLGTEPWKSKEGIYCQEDVSSEDIC